MRDRQTPGARLGEQRLTLLTYAARAQNATKAGQCRLGLGLGRLADCVTQSGIECQSEAGSQDSDVSLAEQNGSRNAFRRVQDLTACRCRGVSADTSRVAARPNERWVSWPREKILDKARGPAQY